MNNAFPANEKANTPIMNSLTLGLNISDILSTVLYREYLLAFETIVDA
ncbi:MAG TPA: hypothetical protein VIH27_02245 [Nitrososphaerales archaeon]